MINVNDSQNHPALLAYPFELEPETLYILQDRIRHKPFVSAQDFVSFLHAMSIKINFLYVTTMLSFGKAHVAQGNEIVLEHAESMKSMNDFVIPIPDITKIVAGTGTFVGKAQPKIDSICVISNSDYDGDAITGSVETSWVNASISNFIEYENEEESIDKSTHTKVEKRKIPLDLLTTRNPEEFLNVFQYELCLTSQPVMMGLIGRFAAIKDMLWAYNHATREKFCQYVWQKSYKEIAKQLAKWHQEALDMQKRSDIADWRGMRQFINTARARLKKGIPELGILPVLDPPLSVKKQRHTEFGQSLHPSELQWMLDLCKAGQAGYVPRMWENATRFVTDENLEQELTKWRQLRCIGQEPVVGQLAVLPDFSKVLVRPIPMEWVQQILPVEAYEDKFLKAVAFTVARIAEHGLKTGSSSNQARDQRRSMREVGAKYVERDDEDLTTWQDAVLHTREAIVQYWSRSQIRAAYDGYTAPTFAQFFAASFAYDLKIKNRGYRRNMPAIFTELFLECLTELKDVNGIWIHKDRDPSMAIASPEYPLTMLTTIWGQKKTDKQAAIEYFPSFYKVWMSMFKDAPQGYFTFIPCALIYQQVYQSGMIVQLPGLDKYCQKLGIQKYSTGVQQIDAVQDTLGIVLNSGVIEGEHFCMVDFSAGKISGGTFTLQIID